MTENQAYAQTGGPVRVGLPPEAKAAAGRRFQVWEYSPSHRTLLLRSPADDKHDDNVDITFSGVRRIALDTLLEIHAIYEVAIAGRPVLHRYSFNSESGVTSVVAEKMQIDSNLKSLFEGLEAPGSRVHEAAMALETEVALAIRRAFPTAVVDRGGPREPDLTVNFADRRAFVEVMWSSEAKASAQIRRRVIDRVNRWGSDAKAPQPLIVIVGGLRDREIAGGLEAHLRTGLGTLMVKAVAWSDAGEDALAEELRRLFSGSSAGGRR